MRRLLAQLVLLIGLLTLTPGWCEALEVSLQRIDANGIGEQGWELVTYAQPFTGYHGGCYTFKRQK